MHHLARRSPARVILALISVALLTLVSVDSARADWGVPEAITDEGQEIVDLYKIVTVVAFAVFLAVEGALLYLVFRFRRRDDTLPPQTHGNNVLEIIWTTIPVIIVLVLFVFAFITLVDVEQEADEEDMTIQVQGYQFSWGFTYNTNDLGVGTSPGGEGEEISIQGTQVNEPTLVIPMGEPIEFALASDDVIHSFYVRNFLYKLDVVPGRDNRFTVTAHETGTFEGQCAELCGLDHALMTFKLEVVTREEFDRWIADQLAAAKSPRQQ